MNTPFLPTSGLVVLTARLLGPNDFRMLRMALDTGATTTMIRADLLVQVGCDPATSHDRIPMTTASGIEYVPRVAVGRLDALHESREPFTVIAHTLPPSATVDGLLGLDFFRGRLISLDFRQGIIHLE